VAEWFKAPVLKTGVPARAPWVRIPPLPPELIETINEFEFLDLCAQSGVQIVFIVAVMIVGVLGNNLLRLHN
jgi:hypothetical protein